MDTVKFKHFPHSQMVAEDRRLICPQCGEFLERADLEGFQICPFCSYQFKKSEELEDFIIEQQVDVWMRQQPGFAFQFLE